MRCATLFVCLFATVAAYGEDGQVPERILKELQSLTGTWQVEGKYGEDKTEGTWSARWAPGKHCLMRHSEVTVGDKAATGIGVIGWDGATEQITEQVFLSNNGCALLRWNVVAPGKWEGEITGFIHGETLDGTVKFTKQGPNEILYEEKSADGREDKAVLRKVKASAEKKPATSVPQVALEELEYRVGKWESVAYVDGKQIEELGYETAEWIPGKHAIRIAGSFVEEGAKIYAGAVVGWDVEKKQLVEHWYTSDGGCATFCYDLDKEKDAWVGTFRWIYADGRIYEGPSRVDKKGKNDWEWNASYESNGEKHSWRTINRRVR